MKRSFAIALAAVTGVVCSLATFFAVTLVYNRTINGVKGAMPLTEFANVEQIIDQYYLHNYDMKEVQYAGLKAMIAALGDPYSEYYTPDEYAALTNELSGEYYGIGMGIAIEEETGLARVEYFIDNSPAEEAGVKTGDYIVSIDGKDVTDMTLQQIGLLCLGKEGEPITLGIRRGDKQLSFTVVRREIARDMLSYKMLDDGIGYMRIMQFGGNCETLFGEAMDYFKQKGAKGIVVDLRDNPGGYLDVVVHMLDKLLPEGTLVYTEDKNGNRETFTSDANCIKIPLTLIVNGHTASAAEIFAGAVQDYEWGKVVGTTTYGKGVVQNVIPLPSTGGGIKITSSQYFTPAGRSIDGNGIYPDEYAELQQKFVDNPSSYSFSEDAQVKKALEVLSGLIG